MNKLLVFLILCGFTLSVKAQQQPLIPTTQPYGKVDKADLELKACDFEKDANAEVLFDKGKMSGDGFERHVRIKVFNNFGTNEANIRLYGADITSISAESINLSNGKIEITQLDKKLIYVEEIDKWHSALVFSLPNAKAGSIIEYKYRGNFSPIWYFQNHLPTRYSEIETEFSSSDAVAIRVIPHVKQAFVKDIGKENEVKQVKALANVHSIPNEPYMGTLQNSLQRIEYLGIVSVFDSWTKIGKYLIKSDNFGMQFERSIAGESAILNRAKSLKSNDEKIAFIFDTVKNTMKWDQNASYITNYGIDKAWAKKTGNSAEINIIVYRLLKKIGIKAFPMLVSTKDYGEIEPANPIFEFNNMIVYIPLDSTKSYVLDATRKFNLFNTIPLEDLNIYGLKLDESNSVYEPVFLENRDPVIHSVFVSAQIQAGGKMDGTVEINSYSYNKINTLRNYEINGEEKLVKYLRNDNNNLKILSEPV